MYIPEEYGDGAQGEIDVSAHKVEVVYVGRKAEVGVRTALVGGNDEFAVDYLELNQG